MKHSVQQLALIRTGPLLHIVRMKQKQKADKPFGKPLNRLSHNSVENTFTYLTKQLGELTMVVLFTKTKR